MYLFIVGDQIKGMHEDLDVVKKWCDNYESRNKVNCSIALEIEKGVDL